MIRAVVEQHFHLAHPSGIVNLNAGDLGFANGEGVGPSVETAGSRRAGLIGEIRLQKFRANKPASGPVLPAGKHTDRPQEAIPYQRKWGGELACSRRSLEGLTTKVQHHYLRRMVSLGILSREVFAEVPPRVEYRLTAFGERFVPLLNQIRQFQAELEHGQPK